VFKKPHHSFAGVSRQFRLRLYPWRWFCRRSWKSWKKPAQTALHVFRLAVEMGKTRLVATRFSKRKASPRTAPSVSVRPAPPLPDGRAQLERRGKFKMRRGRFDPTHRPQPGRILGQQRLAKGNMPSRISVWPGHRGSTIMLKAVSPAGRPRQWRFPNLDRATAPELGLAAVALVARYRPRIAVNTPASRKIWFAAVAKAIPHGRSGRRLARWRIISPNRTQCGPRRSRSFIRGTPGSGFE